jgi:sec-independent protein translocase protein TatC
MDAIKKKLFKFFNRPATDSSSPSAAMTIFEHLHEMRQRIIKSLISMVLIFFVVFTYANEILTFLKQPLLEAMPKTQGAQLYFTGPLDVFFAQIKISVLSTIVISSPIWLFQFWRFIEPGLLPQEKRYVMPLTIFSSALFVIGAAFCFYFVIPAMLSFLLGIGLEVGAPIITINDYLSLIIMMLFACAALFEAPVVIVMLGLMGLITPQMLAGKRKFTFILILITSAIVTPSPDPFSQLALAIPTYLLFEMSIWILFFIDKRKKRELAPVIPAKEPAPTDMKTDSDKFA